MRAVLLIGSPRAGRSTSASLGLHLMEGLRKKGWEIEVLHVQGYLHSLGGARILIASAETADLVVLSFPVYVDSVPAAVVRAMELMVRHDDGTRGRTAMVAIANCGFIEAQHAHAALEICRLFARDAGFEWRGGLAMGGGTMINGQMLAEAGRTGRQAIEALDLAAAALADGKSVPQEAIENLAKPTVPKVLFTLIGNQMWRREARKNGVSSRLRDRPYRERPENQRTRVRER